MKQSKSNRHTIDLIFPIAVFFVFAVSALAVIMLSARLYRAQTQSSENLYTTCTSLAYIDEKIRQNDSGGSIHIRTIEGETCLAIESIIDDIPYTTYIYAKEGMLKELFIRNDAPLHLKDAWSIMEVTDFTMEEIGANLFRFTSADQNGDTSILIASERSMP